MATRNIVPRADNEGSLGTSSKKWSDVRATAGTITTVNSTTNNTTGTATIGTVAATNLSASAATNITFQAGTNARAPINMTAGVNLTTAAAGANEYDGTCFYTTPVASARGLSPSTMFSIVPAGGFNLATTAGVQSAFPTTGDVWTLGATTTYMFEGLYMITHSTTTCTAAMAFACSSAPTAINYVVNASILAANTTSTASNMTFVTQVASTVVTATSTVGWAIKFRGLIRTNGATTVTPQINWSANTTSPVMLTGSYITFTPMGTNTTDLLGNVA